MCQNPLRDVQVPRVAAELERASDYALMAAMRGWMPMMFFTRVRL